MKVLCYLSRRYQPVSTELVKQETNYSALELAETEIVIFVTFLAQILQTANISIKTFVFNDSLAWTHYTVSTLQKA